MNNLAAALFLAGVLAVFGSGGASSADARESAGAVAANVLSDGQFVYGPNVGDFKVHAYFASHAPGLLPVADDLYGRAEYFSVNPKIYLTLMEIRTGVISNPTPAAAADPFGLKSGNFNADVELLSHAMTAAYYLHLYTFSPLPLSLRTLPPLFGTDGAAVGVSQETNAGTYAIIAGLAALGASDIASILDNNRPGGFFQTYRRLFGDDDPRDEQNQLLSLGDARAFDAPANLLQLPYLRGLSWRFGGVHDNNGGAGPGSPLNDASSLDFYPTGSSWNIDTSSMWVVASAGGTPTKFSACGFRVAHGGGWETVYYHLENIQNFSGSINQNDKIGVIANTLAEATCSGGSASGPHVHFSLKFNGAFVAINGTPLAGWYVHAGRTNYDVDHNYMWLERAGVKKYPYADEILSEGNPTAALTVNSTYPASGVIVGTAPNDLGGLGAGTTPYTRTYAAGAVVTLTAPATAGGNPFSNWAGCTSVSGRVCSVTLDTARTATVTYCNPSLPNVPPTLNAIADVFVVMSAGLQTVNFSGITAGTNCESWQTLSVSVTSSNPGLIPNPTVSYSSPNAIGSLSFTPTADLLGSATIAVTVDDGQGANRLVTKSFLVRVMPRADILWQEMTAGWLYDWSMAGVGRLAGSYLAPNLIPPTWRMVGIADFDGDGKNDILWQETTAGWLYVWYMDGLNRKSGTYLTPSKIDPTWRMVGIADFNGDGKKDILWQETTAGWLYVWYMDGVVRLAGSYLTPNRIDPTWRMVGIADFDKDGKADILWQETSVGWLYVWYMNGVIRLSGEYLTPNQIDPTWRMVGVRDFDGDGKVDILWQETTGGWLYVWYMGGAKGVTRLSGSYLSPNQINPTWRMVGTGLLD